MKFLELKQIIKVEQTLADLLEAGKKWDAIRAAYKVYEPVILERVGSRFTIDPYFIDWVSIFTPIEMQAWQTIRSLGIPLYPQYPVGNVFVDFGDPKLKIALECDGKEWHSKDNDIERDLILADQGWVVFRVTGRECNRSSIDMESLREDLHNQVVSEDEFKHQINTWGMGNSEGVITAIGHKFYGKQSSLSCDWEMVLDAHSHTYGEYFNA